MPRKPSTHITDGELRLMQILWHKGSATVLEIQAALDEVLVDSTIRTLLGILEDKGYVERRKEGRAFRYYPLIAESETRVGALDMLMKRFFRNRVDLVLSLLDSDDLTVHELAAIRRAIEQRKKR